MFKRKRDEIEVEEVEEESDSCKKSNWDVRSPGNKKRMEKLLQNLLEEVREMRREQREQREEGERGDKGRD